MSSLILRSTTRFIMPLLLMFSVFLLVRGHNEPGGGFSGGLVAASAFALYSIAHDASAARQLLRIDPRNLVALGLFFSMASGLVSLVRGEPFLTGLWVSSPFPGLVAVHIGTPLLFDIGVYLVVTGVILMIIFAFVEA